LKTSLQIHFFIAIFIAIFFLPTFVFAAYYYNVKADAIYKKINLTDYDDKVSDE